MNRRIILNHDITEATINQGWKRKVGAVANEDNLKKSGQGWDVIINEGYELTDCEKIIASGVPQSDIELGVQLQGLIFSTSGVNLENWSAQEDSNASTLTTLIKQAANLMVLQKYFDQWDLSLKLLGERLLKIILHNWNAAKVSLLIGEEPSPHFYSSVFAQYQVIIEEGLNTAIQRQQEFKQTLEFNQLVGGVIPPSYLASIATLQGKTKLEALLKSQEQQQQAMQQEQLAFAHNREAAELKELYSKAVANIAMARERHGRAESNIGLFEERLSEISQNRSMATKNKVEALEKLLDLIQRYGELEASLKAQELQGLQLQQETEEDREKVDAKQTAFANDFVTSILGQAMGGGQQGQQGQQEQQGQQRQPQQQF